MFVTHRVDLTHLESEQLLRRSTPSRHNQGMSTSRFVRQTSAIVAAIAVLALAGCATPPAGDTAPPAGPAATTPLPPSGEVLGQGTVLDVGGEAEFCLGAIMESYPPQCDGIPLTDWSWDDIQGSESSGDVTWGAYALVGSYDGKSFSPTQAPIMLALFDPAITNDPTAGTQGATGEARLEEIQNEITASRTIAPLHSAIDRGYLWVSVTWDDGTLQQLADATYSPDVVVVQSALRPIGEKSQIDK